MKHIGGCISGVTRRVGESEEVMSDRRHDVSGCGRGLIVDYSEVAKCTSIRRFVLIVPRL